MKLSVILLASGDSRRFDGNKLLYEIQGQPMYLHVAKQLCGQPKGFQTERIVVTKYEEIARGLEEYGFSAVINEESRLGISHSIHLGLKKAADDSGAFLFAVADQPYLSAAAVEGLLLGWRQSSLGMGCLCYGARNGNPAIFAERYREALFSLQGDTGGRQLLKRFPEEVYRHPVTAVEELWDIDSRGDIFSLRQEADK